MHNAKHMQPPKSIKNNNNKHMAEWERKNDYIIHYKKNIIYCSVQIHHIYYRYKIRYLNCDLNKHIWALEPGENEQAHD